MTPELSILIRGLLLCCVWLFVDWRIFKWVGMSPIFGSLKANEKDIDKIRVFSIGVSWYIIIFNFIAFIFDKLRDNIPEQFSYFWWLLPLFVLSVIGNIFTRLILGIYLRKSEDGKRAILFSAIIIGGLLIFSVLSLIIVGGF